MIVGLKEKGRLEVENRVIEAKNEENRKYLDNINEGLLLLDRDQRISEQYSTFLEFAADAEQTLKLLDDNVERMIMSQAEELGKKVKVRTATDFDSLPNLQELRNPIIHLVRNALSHGIEEGLERISKGKSEEGTVEITFTREEDNRCRVEVRDDGRGIDFKAVRDRALTLGLITGENPTSNELLRVLFSPAFSSRDSADEVSGRGVGLDAVQVAVRALGGSISVGTKNGSRYQVHASSARGNRRRREMKVGLIRLLIGIVPIALMASCDRPQPEPDLPPLSVGEISASVLWSRISVESDYSDYSFSPGHEGENPGQSPHGTARAAGALSSCVACYQGVAANDYVIVRRLAAPLEE